MNGAWFKGLVLMAPWLTLVLILAMFSFLYSSLAPAPAVSLDLPDTSMSDSSNPGLVALLLPGGANGTQPEGSLVFFDDARYVLSDPASGEGLARRLGERSFETRCGTLTLLCDRRVPAGDLMRVMELARQVRISHVQVAEKRD